LRSRQAANRLNTHWTAENAACGKPSFATPRTNCGPTGIADGEQEHQEDGRLQRLRDRDSDLPDQDTGEQRGRHRSKADALERELAEVIAQTKRQEYRDLGVLFSA
jgi:hypothetical protein